MKILVFGGRGFLGGRIAETLKAVVCTTDICNEKALIETLTLVRPNVVINAAGKTGHPNVDWCEANVQETFESNTVGPILLANLCASLGIHLIHLASGCIFYGRSTYPDGAWREDEPANPISVYSKSKYAADLALSCYPNVAIVRLRMPIDGRPGPRNLITKLVRYKQVIDVANSVTVVDDLVEVARLLVEKRGTGIFHATNPGVIKHRHILAMYHEMVDSEHRFEFIPEQHLVSEGLVVAPRSNCKLHSSRLEDLGIYMPTVLESVERAMKQYAKVVHG